MATAIARNRSWFWPAVEQREAFWVTVAVAWLLVWLPLQTPVAVLAFQYGGLSAGNARLILLLKDVVVFAGVVGLLARHIRHLELRWFDWLAVGYTLLVGVYAIVPWLLGSELPLLAVTASARIFVLPVELYALGRLAALSGVNLRLLIAVLLGVSAAAALFTVGQWAFTPPTFWTTVMDLPLFVREVQGLPYAVSLWDVSALGHYGVGEGGQFARAVGPFTHPVGAAHYFVVPLLLSVAAAFDASRRTGSGRLMLVYVGLAALFAAAVLVPISRGSWVAAVVGVVICAFAYGRLRVTLAVLVGIGIFLALTPPFSLSIWSALSMQDSSVIGHSEAVEEGINTVWQNPLGLGVGQADQPGLAYGGEASAGVGENMYLALLVTVGPLGLAAFLGWLLGVGISIYAAFRTRGHWLPLALLATLVGFAVSAMTASSLMRFTTSAHFWLLVGLVTHLGVVSAGRQKARERDRQSILPVVNSAELRETPQIVSGRSPLESHDRLDSEDPRPPREAGQSRRSPR